jgi:hypothetical protein
MNCQIATTNRTDLQIFLMFNYVLAFDCSYQQLCGSLFFGALRLLKELCPLKSKLNFKTNIAGRVILYRSCFVRRVVTSLWAGRSVFRFLAGAKHFFLFQKVKTGSEAQGVSYIMGTGGCVLGNKAAGASV